MDTGVGMKIVVEKLYCIYLVWISMLLSVLIDRKISQQTNQAGRLD